MTSDSVAGTPTNALADPEAALRALEAGAATVDPSVR